MKRKAQYGSGLYAYLEQTGVLTNGSDEDITQAKKAYWENYRKAWKKNKKQQSKTYVLLFSFAEQRIINRKAEGLSISPTKYIKQAALSENQSIGPVLVGMMREEIMTFSTSIETIIKEYRISEVVNEMLFEKVLRMEQQLLVILNKAKL